MIKFTCGPNLKERYLTKVSRLLVSLLRVYILVAHEVMKFNICYNTGFSRLQACQLNRKGLLPGANTNAIILQLARDGLLNPLCVYTFEFFFVSLVRVILGRGNTCLLCHWLQHLYVSCEIPVQTRK